MRFFKHILFFFLTAFICQATVKAQDEEFWEDFLSEEVEVENPVYLPVVGIGVGTLHFMGDVKNDYGSPLAGQLGYKVNIATYIDNKHFLRANFFFMGGKLSGENRSLESPYLNYNFQTDILNFGFNINYNFKNFFARERKIMPFVSIGLSNLQFNPKGDTLTAFAGENTAYHYWDDGTIRNISQSEEGTRSSFVVSRDYIFETDLRAADLYGKGRGNIQGFEASNTLAIPIDVGFDLTMSPRVFLRLGYSLNFTFSDFIDNLGGESNRYKGVDRGGNAMKDMFSFTYATLHLDLFSPPKTILVERLFADIDFDPTLIGDEDYDMVFDVSDQCLGTPTGVEVDSVGCPYDDDKDGVPNYLDREAGTPPNAMVDEYGVTIDPDQLAALLNFSDAINRKEVDLYIMNYMNSSNRSRYTNMEVPAKFKSVDKDKDGYISFEEVLETIDHFFDFETNLNIEDIYELNDFFFAQ